MMETIYGILFTSAASLAGSLHDDDGDNDSGKEGVPSISEFSRAIGHISPAWARYAKLTPVGVTEDGKPVLVDPSRMVMHASITRAYRALANGGSFGEAAGEILGGAFDLDIGVQTLAQLVSGTDEFGRDVRNFETLAASGLIPKVYSDLYNAVETTYLASTGKESGIKGFSAISSLAGVKFTPVEISYGINARLQDDLQNVFDAEEDFVEAITLSDNLSDDDIASLFGKVSERWLTDYERAAQTVSLGKDVLTFTHYHSDEKLTRRQLTNKTNSYLGDTLEFFKAKGGSIYSAKFNTHRKDARTSLIRGEIPQLGTDFLESKDFERAIERLKGGNFDIVNPQVVSQRLRTVRRLVNQHNKTVRQRNLELNQNRQ